MTSLLGFYREFGDQPERPLPIEQWDPPFCGDIDMRIVRNGDWVYNGTPVERPDMVRLFSRILRRETDRYVLVTPVEKVGITVEDAPFIATAMQAEDGPALTFRTNVGDILTADNQHPLRFETDEDGFRPYIHVRHGLEARLTRQLARDLADILEVEDGWLGVKSCGCFFRVAPADAELT